MRCFFRHQRRNQKKIRFETKNAVETIENIINAVQKLGCGKAIGISCGGPLDSKRGVILSPPNLPGWDNIEIIKILKEKFGVPVGIQNDANACALAEWLHGAGKKCENMIFLTFGTGMGAGIILNGRLYTGSSDMAGEIGHIRMEKYGPVGYGKAGSFEGFCSGSGIAETGRFIAIEKLRCGENASFCKSYKDLGGITAKKIAECAKNGDTAAIEVYNICAEKLGMGISILIDILNPEKIIIGSVYERSGELLRTKMLEVIKEEALPQSRNVCEILPSALGDAVGDMAAMAVAENIWECENL